MSIQKQLCLLRWNLVLQLATVILKAFLRLCSNQKKVGQSRWQRPTFVSMFRPYQQDLRTLSYAYLHKLVFGDTTIPRALSARTSRKYVYRNLDPKLFRYLSKDISLDCVVSVSEQP
ncbi:MAG: hypothetical protein EZS28_046145 [Streblomastix strix]|uniref:Uncharacterized protein n=1 Tax=Streblomastix strix TaxID=222440 RepID=A0A5J4TKJ0_9EUKA|nr:MAG: hypothetical protein EZS28_046145 [Streblomastix strix]